MPELPELNWQKATDEETGEEECLEVAFGPDEMVYLRESHKPEKVVVTTQVKWDAFVLGVKAGEFDHFVEE